MVIDCFTYNGESDILEIRLNVLDKYVDEFVICEASQTFSGKEKPFYFDQERKRFAKWLPKIKYYRIDNFDDQELWDMAHNSPNTIGASHWKQEFYIKESIKKSLTHLSDDDIVFVGDCDEIWNVHPDDARWFGEFQIPPYKLKLQVYTYWLNNRSSEEFFGTLQSRYCTIRDNCLNHLRSNTKGMYAQLGMEQKRTQGWHFTSLAGGLKRKLEDSYTSDSYANPLVMNNLENNIKDNKDFLGRDFTYTLDESNWPKYLIEHKQEYINLCK